MSAPRHLRAVFDACRPIKTPAISSPASSASTRCRAYHISKPLLAPYDIRAGFPTPPGSENRRATESTPSPNIGSEPNPSKPQNRISPTRGSSSRTPPTQPPSASRSSTAVTSSNVPAQTPATQNPSESQTIPPNVYAAYRTPLRHKAEHGIPVASLQLRSFSVRNLEFFADFAMRAAYYLNLPASGPVPLPKRIERWTVLRSNFVHKKSQENFERITMKRLITVYDGDPSVVEVWLAFLRKHQFYGVGMKANVWEWEGLDVAAKMDRQSAESAADLEAKLANFGFNKTAAKDKDLDRLMQKRAWEHAGMPMSYLREASTTADQKV